MKNYGPAKVTRPSKICSLQSNFSLIGDRLKIWRVTTCTHPMGSRKRWFRKKTMRNNINANRRKLKANSISFWYSRPNLLSKERPIASSGLIKAIDMMMMMSIIPVLTQKYMIYLMLLNLILIEHIS